MKLISMTDYVLESQRFKEDSDTAIFKVTNYANFLKQPLNLGMFIPCDEDGDTLEVPYYADGIDKVNKYKEAKERVLFEGFEIDFEDGCINPFIEHFPIGFFNIDNKWVLSDKFKTIEDFTIQKLTLTKSAIEALDL